MPSKLFWFKSIYIKNPEMIIKKKYKASFMLDDAHGLGVIGDGSGSNSFFRKKPDIDIYLGTLSKAVGTYGGFICGKKNLINL